MKIFLVLFVSAVLICNSCCESDDDNEIFENIRPKLLHYIIRSPKIWITQMLDEFEDNHPGERHVLKNALILYTKCTASIDTNKTMCSELSSFEQCGKPIQKLMKEYLSTDKMKLFEFIVKSKFAISKYLCKQDAESLIELKNPCALDYVKKGILIGSKKLKEDTEKFNPIAGDLYKLSYMNPEYTCLSMSYLPPLYEDMWGSICNNPKAQHLYAGIWQTMLDHVCRDILNGIK